MWFDLQEASAVNSGYYYTLGSHLQSLPREIEHEACFSFVLQLIWETVVFFSLFFLLPH